MKFQLLFFLVLAVVFTFFANEAEAAPSKNHGKHQLFTASNIKLLGQFFQKESGHDDRQHNLIASFQVVKKNSNGRSNTNTRAIENSSLQKLLNHLTWLSELKVEEYYSQILDLAFEMLHSYTDFDAALFAALVSVGVDFDSLYPGYWDPLEEEYSELSNNFFTFWRKWLEEPEQIPENLLVFTHQVQHYLTFYATSTFGYIMNLINLSQTLLTPEAFEQVLVELRIFLDQVVSTYDKLRAALRPPTETPLQPTNLTIEEFLGFLPYLGELNVTSIILDGLSTAEQLKNLRLTFDKYLVTLFGEASEDGADSGSDLESQGREITERFEAVVEEQYAENRRSLDNLVYMCFYGGAWDCLVAFVDLLKAYIDGFYSIPPLAVETIVQLDELVDTLSPEFQQRASELVSLALKNADTLIKNYLEVFRPKQ